MDKKKIIVLIFVLLIVCTIVASFLLAIRIYNEEVAEAEKIGRDYRFVGFGAFAMILLGMFVVVYEIDLFYTVYSAAIKPKPVIKTIFSILANLCLMLLTAGLLFYFLHGAAPAHNTPVIYRVVDKIEWIAFYMYLPLRLGALIAALVSRKADEKKQKAEA